MSSAASILDSILHPILHIVSKAVWSAFLDQGSVDQGYVDPSLAAEGFIHCSTPEQVLIPANERFAGQTDLILLVIDPAKLTAPLIFEDCYESGMAFPHIYGPIDAAAVTAEVPFPCNDDGTFTLPQNLTEQG